MARTHKQEKPQSWKNQGHIYIIKNACLIGSFSHMLHCLRSSHSSHVPSSHFLTTPSTLVMGGCMSVIVVITSCATHRNLSSPPPAPSPAALIEISKRRRPRPHTPARGYTHRTAPAPSARVSQGSCQSDAFVIVANVFSYTPAHSDSNSSPAT